MKTRLVVLASILIVVVACGQTVAAAGKTYYVSTSGDDSASGLANPFTATRYHSLIVDPAGLDDDFEQTAWTTDQNELMGIRSKTHPTEGVQFHPESFLTDTGHALSKNFLVL